jgi:16S rRNA (uracil1498-N3)-methyltransferase
MEYTADVSRVERGSITCTIRERRTCEIEPAANLTLAVGLLKNVSRFEVLVEKSTELGAAAIVPLTTERTVAFHDRGNRWTRIAVSAMIQSGRAVLPRISGVTPLDAFLGAAPPEALRLIAHERATGPLLAEVPARAQTVVCIGPEGGFSEAELGRAVAAGFQPVSLGARRLRTETAGIVAAALILSRLPG